jgi:putative hemolysin
MLEPRGDPRVEPKRRLAVHVARGEAEILEAQRLRYRVFAEEMGARLPTADEGIDRDPFDAWCEHMLVTEEDTGEVVGTYRILTGETAKRVGGFYSDQEFDLTRLNHLRDQMVEIGRSCVHPDHRRGGVIALLWSGVLEYIQRTGYEYILGCASLSMVDGGHSAAAAFKQLRESHLSSVEYRVFPRCPLPLHELDQNATPSIAPLIKAYIRVGAHVCGEPAWDPDFNTADLLMLLPLSRMTARYARHFLRHAA